MKEIKKSLTEREYSLLNFCLYYSDNTPSGLPGHVLMIIIAKLVKIILKMES